MELGKVTIDWLKLLKFAKKNLSVTEEFNLEDLPRINEIANNNSIDFTMEINDNNLSQLAAYLGQTMAPQNEIRYVNIV